MNLLDELEKLIVNPVVMNDTKHEEEGYYVASSIRPKFHRPSCHWASYFLGTPRLLVFSSHDEAVEADLKPCNRCRA